MKLFYMILASLITVLMASYALWLIAHIDMPLPKRLVQLFPPLFSFNHGILTDFLAFHQIRRTK